MWWPGRHEASAGLAACVTLRRRLLTSEPRGLPRQRRLTGCSALGPLQPLWDRVPGSWGLVSPVVPPSPGATNVLIYLQHLIPGGAGLVPMFVLAQRMPCKHCPGQADYEV